MTTLLFILHQLFKIPEKIVKELIFNFSKLKIPSLNS